MNENGFPVQLLPAIGTVIAALIAAAFSFVNMTLAKEQKTSEFRQAWIDALREDIAAFLSSARAFARAVEDQTGDPVPGTGIDSSKIIELRLAAAERFYKIRLRLNLAESKHETLLELLQVVIAEQNDHISRPSAGSQKVLQAVDRVADHAGPMLKAEWERVKRGERPFRIARNFVAPITFFSALALIAFLLVKSSDGA